MASAPVGNLALDPGDQARVAVAPEPLDEILEPGIVAHEHDGRGVVGNLPEAVEQIRGAGAP